MLEPALTTEVCGQIERVAARSPAQLPTVEAAASVIPALVTRLGLRGFVGALAADHKPRFLLRFRTASRAGSFSGTFAGTDSSDVVLKVYGDAPRGEGPLQGEWLRRGIPVPRLRFGVELGCSWILLEYLDLRPVDVGTVQSRRWLTDTLAALGASLHGEVPALEPVLRPLPEVMLPRLASSVSSLRTRGITVPESWFRLARRVYSTGRQGPVHGDLAPANLGRRADGGAVLFDASALRGPPAFDAARWAARLTRWSLEPVAPFARWLRIEQLDHDQDAERLLALECLLEAGAIEAERSPGGPARVSSDVADPVEVLTELARTVLD